MTNDQPYMNGVGLMAHTRELTAAMWDKLPGAWLGTSAVFVGPLLSWGIFIHRMSWDPPPTTFSIAIGIILALASIGGGVWFALPWHRACRELRKHTEAMERELKLRGNGWARS